MIRGSGLRVIDGNGLLRYSFDENLIVMTEEENKRRHEYFKGQEKKDFIHHVSPILGGFVFLRYEELKPFSLGDKISQADLTRIVHLATYLGYNDEGKGYLQFDNGRPISLNSNLTNLSLNKQREFYNRLIDNDILYQVDGLLRLNGNYFFKGSLTDNSLASIRVYVNTLRELYKQIPTNQHKVVGLLIRLIPFLNYRYNVICENPAETKQGYVRPLTINEISKKVNYSKNGLSKTINTLKETKINGSPLIILLDNKDRREKYIYVNQILFYRGNEPEALGTFLGGYKR